jgi:uncharacterized protein
VQTKEIQANNGGGVGRVVEVWRYAVKSLRGERIDASDVGPNGLTGDRSFGIVDVSAGLLLSAKRTPELLSASARLREDGEAIIELPSGEFIASDDARVDEVLSNWLGRPVELRRPKSGKRSLIEIEVDIDDPTQIAEFSTQAGLFHDGSVMHLLSTESLRMARSLAPKSNWLAERFRPNVLIEPFDVEEEPSFVDDAWVGQTASIGSATLLVHKLCDRCVLITRAVGDAPADKMILRTLHRHHNSDFGVKAHVATSGRIAVGNTVSFEPTH